MNKEITQFENINVGRGFRYPGYNEAKELRALNDRYIEKELPELLLRRLKSGQGLNIDDMIVKITEKQLGMAITRLMEDNYISNLIVIDGGYNMILNEEKIASQ